MFVINCHITTNLVHFFVDIVNILYILKLHSCLQYDNLLQTLREFNLLFIHKTNYYVTFDYI